MFVDEVTIQIKSGNGGDGALSFRREKYVAYGGPDGGDGGNGGDVVLQTDEGLHTLAQYRYQQKFAAEAGEKGGAGRRHGKNGNPCVLTVPPGTVVRDEQGRVLADMTDVQGTVLLSGGKGGRGNAAFTTATRQAPNFAQQGDPGKAMTVCFELRSIADVGLVGFPNAGKSTLLSRVSAARPRIADYPFTTLTPNLGVVDVDDSGFIMADIPGLVEGASEGVGLGIQFLRHVDRTRLLVHIVDAAAVDGRDPVQDYHAIMAELAAYSPELAQKPMIVVANKMDVYGADVGMELLREELPGVEVFPISAIAGIGIRELLYAIQKRLVELPPIIGYEPEVWEQDTSSELGFEVVRDNEAYVLTGFRVQRLLRGVNFDDEESVRYFQRTLRTSGMIDALRDAGAEDGDTIRVGDTEFDFTD